MKCHAKQTIVIARSIPVLLASLTMSLPALAHHSFNMFDMENTITLEGRVTEFRHVNPHGYVTVETTDEQGETVVWEIETISAATMNRRDIRRDSLAEGEWVRIVANPARNPDRRFANGVTVEKLDGTQLLVSFDIEQVDLLAAVPDPVPSPSLEGTWRAETRFLDVLLPEVLTEWPLTAKSRTTLAEYDGSQNPWVNCVPYSPPVINLAPLDMRIELGETEVIFFTSTNGPYRIVHLDQSEHPEGIEASNEGYSIGHWEGDTLVIDTMHFTARELGHAFGIPSGAGKHLIERLTLNEGGTTFTYEYSVEDPEYLTATVTGENIYHHRPDVTLAEASCDADSARRFLEIY